MRKSVRQLFILRETLRTLTSREIVRAIGGSDAASEIVGDIARLPGRPKTGEVVQ
jgi:hypothetical protein